MRPLFALATFVALATSVMTVPPASATTNDASHTVARAAHARRPIVIGHRGACGYRPEHTLASYRLAIQLGADFIEPDLVATKDGVLVARHENEISGTTDVAQHPEFASRRTTKIVDGASITGWFTEDFTLAELKTLRAKERIPAIRPGNTRYDGQFQIPTFDEVIELAKRESRPGHPVGIYPETKHPTYFLHEGRRLDGTPIGFSLGDALVRTLVAHRFTDPDRIYIQSFEFENLIELKTRIMPAAGINLPLIQLYDELDAAHPRDVVYHAMRGDDPHAIYGGLADVVALGTDTTYSAFASTAALTWMQAHYATGIGPWKVDLLPRVALDPKRDANGDGKAELATRNTGAVHPLLPRAIAAGLRVHPYTLRAEEPYLSETPAGIPQSALAEAVMLYSLGVDGLFTDQPDIGVAARDLFMRLAAMPHTAAP